MKIQVGRVNLLFSEVYISVLGRLAGDDGKPI